MCYIFEKNGEKNHIKVENLFKVLRKYQKFHKEMKNRVKFNRKSQN